MAFSYQTPLRLLCLILLISCKKARDPLQTVLQSDDPLIRKVMDSLPEYEVQIIFSKIHRQKDSVWFEDFEFQADDSLYFYPASTVKFPIAVLALEKLEKEGKYTLDTPFYVEGDSVTTTFSKEITKVFAISDNEANNRLFEYLGQDYINQKLQEKGLVPSRISHRLSTPNADDVTTKPLIFSENDSTLVQIGPFTNSSIEKLNLKGIEKGIGYYQDDSLMRQPFDFSHKNYLPLKTLHNVLKRVVFPKQFSSKDRFSLSEESYNFLLKSMSMLPKEAGYDPTIYYDSYVKFFMVGDSKENIPQHLKIYNKVGYAYGTVTDCAYIVDEKNKVEFLLSATILANKDGIFNDNQYEYEQTAIPFLAALGRALHSELIKN